MISTASDDTKPCVPDNVKEYSEEGEVSFSNAKDPCARAMTLESRDPDTPLSDYDTGTEGCRAKDTLDKDNTWLGGPATSRDGSTVTSLDSVRSQNLREVSTGSSTGSSTLQPPRPETIAMAASKPPNAPPCAATGATEGAATHHRRHHQQLPSPDHSSTSPAPADPLQQGRSSDPHLHHTSPPPHCWSVADVGRWVSGLGLGGVAARLEQQMVTGEVLLALTEADLKHELRVEVSHLT